MASAGAYTLVVEDRLGNLTDEYTFDSGELVVGRSRQCDIVIPSENVSRRHARIYTTSGGLAIEDLQSANGVFVNGRRIDMATELTDDATVRLGDFHLHVHGGRKSAEEGPIFLRLVGLSAAISEQVFEINQTTTLIGRGRDCGLVLVDQSISRVHARLMVRPDGSVLIEDVGSANGVFVGNQRVKVWQLKGGDRLKLGGVEFLVEIPSANTSETRVGKARESAGGLLGTLSNNLPWVVASVCALAVIILLLVVVPDILKKRNGSVPATPPPAVAAEPAAPKPSAADAITAARRLLDQGKVEEASAEVAKAQAIEPASVDVVKLGNRVQVERTAAEAIAAADKAEQADDAARLLLQVPSDSVFKVQVATRLGTLRPKVEAMRRKACRGRSYDCDALQALLARVDKAL